MKLYLKCSLSEPLDSIPIKKSFQQISLEKSLKKNHLAIANSKKIY